MVEADVLGGAAAFGGFGGAVRGDDVGDADFGAEDAEGVGGEGGVDVGVVGGGADGVGHW